MIPPDSQLAELWRLHARSVQRVLECSHPASRSVIEDVLQDVFLDLWKHPRALANVRQPRAWLIALTRHRLFAVHAKDQRRILAQRIALEEGTLSDEHPSADDWWAAHAPRLLAGFSPRQQRLITLRYREGWPLARIAEAEKVTVRTVSNCLGKFRRRAEARGR